MKVTMVNNWILMLLVVTAALLKSSAQEDSLSYLIKSFSSYEYQKNGSKVSKNDFYYTLSKDKTLLYDFKSGKARTTTGSIITFIGGFLVGWNLGDFMFKKGEKKYTLGLIGAGAIALGLPISWSGHKKSDRAIYQFNKGNFTIIDNEIVALDARENLSSKSLQKKENKTINYKQILDSSCIIVRIPVNANKINLLSKKIKEDNISQKVKSQLKEELKNTIAESKNHLNLIQKSFDLHFKIKEVYFIPDSSFKSHLAGIQTGFLNNKGVMDQNLRCPHDNFFYFIDGKDKEQLLFVDHNLTKPMKPLPHRKNTFLPTFKKIFNKQKYIENQIIYFNEKLSKL